MTEDTRKCPDCGTEMHEIRIVDKSQGLIHTDLEYALTESKARLGLNYPLAGVVKAHMCPACARITLYGAAKAPR